MMGSGMGPTKDYVEPDKGLRQYFRHAKTGDLGYLVQGLDGSPRVKFDRPNDLSTVPYNPADWKEELHAEPLGRAQAASIAYESDRALCGFLGLPMNQRKEWRMLSHKERVEFVGRGPAGPSPRKEVYAAIMGALAPFTRPE